MEKVLHMIYHSLGICGEGHLDIFSFVANGFHFFQFYAQQIYISTKIFLKFYMGFGKI